MTPAGILHVDAAIVVADKPAGLLAVPGRLESDCLAARVAAQVPDALVVHRLDMATSGLMLFARGAEMQRRLARAFAERAVEKRYAAIVHGRPARADGEIDLPLAADWPNRPKQKVDRRFGKPSLTRWRCLDADAAADVALLELVPVTGRTHQLRVHLHAVGHAILGDTLYAAAARDIVAPRLLLHAERLAFSHPASGRRFEIASGAPFGLKSGAAAPK